MPNPKGGTPPEEHRFKPGQSGNPGGKTKKQRANEVRASELASEATLAVMEGIVAKLDGGSVDDLLTADVLRYIQEAQDRAHGKPRQSVDNTSSDGSMTPKPSTIELVAKPIQDDNGPD